METKIGRPKGSYKVCFKNCILCTAQIGWRDKFGKPYKDKFYCSVCLSKLTEEDIEVQLFKQMIGVKNAQRQRRNNIFRVA